MDKRSPVYVAGHRGMVGSAIVRALHKAGHSPILVAGHRELDLTEQAAVRAFFASRRPRYVFLAAAKVGGIHANSTYPAEFILQNLMVESNVIEAAWRYGVERLLFLGSSCIYPRLASQPISEDALLTGPLEPTNEPYAIAKIAGIKLCESFNRQYGTDFRAVMPTNLYGPGDNYDLANGHVVPALLRKFHEAKQLRSPQVEIWGSGTPRREFMHVDDMADACLFIMGLGKGELQAHVGPTVSHLNVGTGTDVAIRELAEMIGKIVGYEGELKFNTDKPDGMPRKLLDVSLLARLGWRASTGLEEGLTEAYQWFVEYGSSARR